MKAVFESETIEIISVNEDAATYIHSIVHTTQLGKASRWIPNKILCMFDFPSF